MAPRYQENRYSPSQNYNSQGQGNYNSYNSQNRNFASHQDPRRGGVRVERVDRFRRDPVNYSEKITKQNDLIIRLLKEIRDRLPAPAGGLPEESEIEVRENVLHIDETERVESSPPAPIEPTAEAGDQPAEISAPEETKGNE